jgi:pyruvate/2-oxoglutarate/acetoin dehydrogenase E1 component
MLKGAIRDENPVIFLEHKRLYSVKGPPPANGQPVPLGEARVAREGADVTLVAISKGVVDALAAAELLSSDGVDAEVIDLRTLRPLDLDTVLRSVAKTNRVVAIEEGPRVGGWAANLIGGMAAEALHDLDDAWVIATDETPIPYSPPLEDAFMPDGESIAAQVGRRLGARA